MSIAYRKLGQFNLAEKYLTECLAYRQRIFGEKNWVTVDSVIHLAILYREMGRAEQAFAHLALAESIGVKEQGFQRICQVQHLRALLHRDAAQLHEARDILEDVMHDASVNGHINNRELMWIRLTLAGILRTQQGHDAASTLFSSLVKPIGIDDEIVDEPESPAQLRIVEEAIRLVKHNDLERADKHLRKNNIIWCCPEVFWIMSGGPAAETEWTSAISSPETPILF